MPSVASRKRSRRYYLKAVVQARANLLSIAFTYVCRVVNVYLYAHPKACVEACHSCVCVCVCVQTLFTAYFDDKYVAHTLTTNELLQTRS